MGLFVGLNEIADITYLVFKSYFGSMLRIDFRENRVEAGRPSRLFQTFRPEKIVA